MLRNSNGLRVVSVFAACLFGKITPANRYHEFWFWLTTLHALFVLPIATLAYLYNNVIKSESLVLIKDFAMQCSTTYASGTVRNALIPIEYVQDVLLNWLFGYNNICFNLC
uniref:Uncharacterized protein n=1 Tax=Anopheles culicifacies TaxID=139723 RepID=A0A182LWU8_9DIPT